MAKNKRQKRRERREEAASESILLLLEDVPVEEFEGLLAEHELDADLASLIITISRDEGYSHRCLKIIRTSAQTMASFSCNLPADPALGEVSRSGHMYQFEWDGKCWQDTDIVLEFGG